jgi:hypothetical protein
MAMWTDKKEFIFKAVEEMYTDVASRPGAVFHFPTGRLSSRVADCRSRTSRSACQSRTSHVPIHACGPSVWSGPLWKRTTCRCYGRLVSTSK